MRNLSIYSLFFCIVLLFVSLEVHAADPLNRISTGVHTFKESSVLKTGKWVKISIQETGIYQLTADDLKAYGFNDITKVKLYGFGGAMLAENFKIPHIDDLPEVPLFRTNNSLLFYGVGVVNWKFNTLTLGNYFTHIRNPYSIYGYYFLTENDKQPLIMNDQENSLNTATEVNTFNEYVLHEKELVNVTNSGREFYGESFSYKSNQDFSMFTPGIVGPSANIGVNFISKASVLTKVSLSINSQLITTASMPMSDATNRYEKAIEINFNSSWNPQSKEQQIVNINYANTGHKNCYLNYIRINYERNLSLSGSYTFFRNINSITTRLKYNIKNVNSNVQIWDVTDPIAIKQQKFILNNNTGEASFTSKTTGLREYVIVDVSKTFSKPNFVGVVQNQDLHSLPQADMIIITAPGLLEEARRFKTLKEKTDPLKIHILTSDAIYNEFSSGTPDATAYRLALKMFYDRGLANSGNSLKYLILFGDGSFDNRSLLAENKVPEVANHLLTFQSYNSLNEQKSYVSDDYFGFMDDNSGVNLNSDLIDIGIGRFPIKTLTQARQVVDKIAYYLNNTQLGVWKNNICFVADDKDRNEHMRQANELSNIVEKSNKEFVTNKIYIDAFQKVIAANSESTPGAKKKLFDLIDSGILLLNYTGHGSTTAWAGEGILKIEDVRSLYNKKLPLWVTATCDFSRYDDINTSAGEEVFLNPNGGGIALFTTTRIVYSAPNFAINSEFIRNIFAKQPNGVRLRLGDIMRLTKRSLGNDQNKLSFTLLGDPSLFLSYPEYKVRITEMNGKSVDLATDTIKALKKISMKGEVLNPDGSKAVNYKGFILPTVFDCESDTILTLDNEGAGNPFKYTERSKILFTGRDSIRNGDFSFSFVAPKDISYSYNTGRVNLYCYNQNGIEGQGYFENFLVGGSESNISEDSSGPVINSIYLNSPTFKDGDIVNETPMFVADIEDNTGLNISGNGIGHDISLVIDVTPTKRYILNNYFIPEFGHSSKGRIMFKIPELPEGKQTMKFKVWDVLNNSTEKELTCVVNKGYKPQIYNLYTDKNPATDQVNFYLKHDRPGNILKIKIRVFNLQGTEVWSKEESGVSDLFTSFPIEWNMMTFSGNRVSPGIYVYQAIISTDGEQESTEAKKLVVLAQ